MKTVLKIFSALFFLCMVNNLIALENNSFFSRKSKEVLYSNRGPVFKKTIVTYFLQGIPLFQLITPTAQRTLVKNGKTTFQSYDQRARLKLCKAGKYGLGILGLGTLLSGIYSYFNWYKK